MTDDDLFRQIKLATHAIDAIVELRHDLKQGMMAPPDRDSTLAKAEYHVRGVRDELIHDLGVESLEEAIGEYRERLIEDSVEQLSEGDNNDG